ncbi:MAG: hypothetical protein Q8P50_15140 [Bacillota bacterium]|jgi:methyl-accepting chemotaxis protein|nr:hypothetical protein [Bacillota bacterium]
MSEKFLNAEKVADDLVTTLDALRKQISTYKSAADDLALTRDRLASLIDKTDAVAVGALACVDSIKTISGPEVINEMNAFSNRLEDQSKVLGNAMSEVTAALTQVSETNNSLSRIIPEQLSSLTEGLKGISGQLAGLHQLTTSGTQAQQVDFEHLRSAVSALSRISVANVIGVIVIIGILLLQR